MDPPTDLSDTHTVDPTCVDKKTLTTDDNPPTDHSGPPPFPTHRTPPTDPHAAGSSSSHFNTYSSAPPFANTTHPWTFGSSGVRWSPEFIPWFGGRTDQANRYPPMFPILVPAPLQGYSQGQTEDPRTSNGGIFAVPVVPLVGSVVMYPPGGLIPVSYNLPQALPTGTPSAASQPLERDMPAPVQQDAQGVEAPIGGAQIGEAQMIDGQRHIRRFHVALQIDLLLILKLAIVVFLFSQDGSKDRLFLLLFLAGLVYLYQTGALTPFLRWLSQSAQRAMMPPEQLQPLRPMPGDARVRARVEEENAAANEILPGEAAAGVQDDQGVPGAAAIGGGEAREHAVEQAHPPAWWGFLKEVQMLIVGFVTSLLPGFHQHID